MNIITPTRIQNIPKININTFDQLSLTLPATTKGIDIEIKKVDRAKEFCIRKFISFSFSSIFLFSQSDSLKLTQLVIETYNKKIKSTMISFVSNILKTSLKKSIIMKDSNKNQIPNNRKKASKTEILAIKKR